MLKLYKSVKDRIHYWEIWKQNTKLVVHTGWVGHWGKTKKVDIAPGESERTAIKRYAVTPRENGYAPISDDEHKVLIVQYAVEGWGDGDDLTFREEVYELMNEDLGWTGNGRALGGDVGSGTINVFARVIDPVLAVNSLVLRLKKAKKLEGVVIAASTSPAAGFEAGVGVGIKTKVLWPTGSRKPFSIWGAKKKKTKKKKNAAKPAPKARKAAPSKTKRRPTSGRGARHRGDA